LKIPYLGEIPVRKRSIVTPDDFKIDKYVSVLHNRIHQNWGPATSSDYLKGVVLKIVAINLPYLVVEGWDPAKGTGTFTVDVREHKFMALNGAYVEAVQRTCAAKNNPDPGF